MKDFSHLDLHGYLKIFRRRIWYFIATFVLVGSGAGVYIWRLPLLYKSTTVIMATSRFIPEDYIGPVFRETINDRMESVRHQLQSRTFLESIAQEFPLGSTGSDAARSTESAANTLKSNMELGVVSNSSFTLGFYATDPGVAQAVVKRLAEAVIRFNQNNSRDRGLVADQFLDEQVRQAERDMNDSEAKLAEFKKQYRDRLPDDSIGNFINLADLQAKFAAAESARLDALEQRKATEEQIKEERLLRLTAGGALWPDTPSLETSQKAAPPGDPGLKALQDQLAQKRGTIRDLTARYTSKWPDLDRLNREAQDLESQIQQYKSNLASDLTALSENKKKDSGQGAAGLAGTLAPDAASMPDIGELELKAQLLKFDSTIAKRQQERDDLARQVANFKMRLNLPPDIEVELRSLSQSNENAKQRYSYLLGKKFSSELSIRVETSNKNEPFRIIDEANLPSGPAKPDRFALASMGLLAAIALGFGMVFVREFFDPTLGSEDEAVRQLRLPVLIIVPDISNKLPKRSKKRSLRSSHAA